MTPQPGYTIFPLGDAAATLDLGNSINPFLNDKVIATRNWMLANPIAGQLDIIVAYSSLTIIYDPAAVRKSLPAAATVFEQVKGHLATAFEKSVLPQESDAPVIRIPVCYAAEFAPDLPLLSAEKSLTMQEIIDLHTAPVYRVYTIGFLPGFCYLASLHDKLVTARKQAPVPVAAGSVGIAGAQTGIYPMNSPGGWNIIGRTPIQLFNASSEGLVKLKPGDRVQFYSISKKEMRIGWLEEGLIG
ncbi:MAG: 5-oxoprolinase subunit PxpB [Bacteroidota bacterium]|nr:5-oxoprolinase subunit PxpB [Bacteroidota bacterium]